VDTLNGISLEEHRTNSKNEEKTFFQNEEKSFSIPSYGKKEKQLEDER